MGLKRKRAEIACDFSNFLTKHFILDTWNLLDFFSLSLIFWTMIFRVCGFLSRENQWGDEEAWIYKVRVVSSMAVVFSYLNLLYYMQGFTRLGKLVRMIICIMAGIASFVLVMLIILLGFSLGFFILFKDEKKDESFWHAFFAGYTVMIGSFDPAEFESGGIDYFTRAEARCLFLLFTFFINIIMLNLLITYMADIFQEV